MCMKYLACPNGSRVMAVLYMLSAKFDNQPDPMSHFGDMALELAKIAERNRGRSVT